MLLENPKKMLWLDEPDTHQTDLYMFNRAIQSLSQGFCFLGQPLQTCRFALICAVIVPRDILGFSKPVLSSCI